MKEIFLHMVASFIISYE